nr:precorrin-6A/cobalt-precorrin-6A reductase [Pseudomonas aeruginosa]
MKRLLLLGGIGEALALARRLGPGASLQPRRAGKVPGDLACRVRVERLRRRRRAGGSYEQGFDLLGGRTHPYAARISQNAVARRATGPECPAGGAGPGWGRARRRSALSSRLARLIAALAPFRRPLFTLGREPLEHPARELPPHQHWTVRCLQRPGRAAPLW